MHVRHLDWEESLPAEQAQQSKDTTDKHEEDAGNQPGAATEAGTGASLAPHVAIEDKFEVVIGTDILYEVGPMYCHLHPLQFWGLSAARAVLLHSWESQAILCFAGSSLKACGCCAETPLDHPWTSSPLLCSQGSGQYYNCVIACCSDLHGM